MKKLVLAVAVLLLTLAMASCTNAAIRNEKDLIDTARAHIPTSGIDTDEISIVNRLHKNNYMLVWFVSGGEHSAKRYTPMEFEVSDDGEYTYSHTYNPMVRGTDVYALNWRNGYSYLVANPECTSVHITYPGGSSETVQITKTPFHFYRTTPETYKFLNSDGAEIY